MDERYVLTAIVLSGMCTFFLRVLPFLFFKEGGKTPAWMEKLGRTSPAAVMAVLVIYCMKDITGDYWGIGIPKLVAVIVVIASYKWKHNTLCSMGIGTATYMVLLNVL
ncbi:MAG: AzlD domain-containing protein [Roseburia sp.]|nr:AzlD domain-containing protein [Roseburia sp.]